MNNSSFIQGLKNEIYSSKNSDKNLPTIEDIKLIVKDIFSLTPLRETCKKVSANNPDEGKRKVLDVIATFGTWLTHSEGKSEADILYLADLPFGEYSQSKKIVIVPRGYEIGSENKRDVSKAMGRILSLNPSDDIIARFYSRTYQERSTSLDYTMIANVWGFATRDRLKYIKNVSSDELFLNQVILAYETVENEIKSSIKFFNKLSSKNLKLDKKIIKELEKYSWVSEVEILDLKKIFDLYSIDKSLKQNYDNSCERFFNRIPFIMQSMPKYVEELNAGQLRRIVKNLGIDVDYDQESRANENDIRSKLKSYGFTSDMDKLLPEALRAHEKGYLDDFWSILELRSEGDSSWHEQIQELLI